MSNLFSAIAAVHQKVCTGVAIGIGATCLLGFQATAQSYDPAQPNWTNPALPAAIRVNSPALVPLSASIPVSTSGTVLDRDPALDEMAEALGHDIDRIYELISNEVRTSPGFGLTKGAFGVHLDMAGNPFDQAHLMVELLRASDANASTAYNPQYVYGTVSLSGVDFTDVFGVTTARGACEVLAAGGVPAQVNGSGQACSSFNASTSISGVDFRHVWVRASIDGVNYDFDPSLKGHIFRVADSSLLSAVPGASQLRSGVTTGSVPGTSVPTAAGFNTSALASSLAAATSSIRSQIETAEASSIPAYGGNQTVNIHIPLEMEDVVGGFVDIVRAERFIVEHGLRQPTLPGHSALNLWAEIPDRLRTYVHMRVTANAAVGTMELTYPAADLAGRRIWVAEDNAVTPQVPTDPATITLNVLIDEVIAENSSGQPASFDADTGYGTHGNHVVVEVAIHHPVFTNTGGAGSNATSAYAFNVWNAFPSYFALGFGERGTRAQVRNTTAVAASGLASWPQDSECLPGAWGVQCSFVLKDTFQAQLNSLVSLAEAYLVQSSRTGDMVAGLSGGRHVSQHAISMASMFVQLNTAQTPYLVCSGTSAQACTAVQYDGLLLPRLGGQQLVADVTSRSGFAAIDASASNRDVFASTFASMLVGLEQVLLQSNTDSPSVGAPPAMFDWFANASQTEAFSSGVSSGFQTRFLEIPAGLGSQARNDGIAEVWFGPGVTVAPEFASEYGDFTIITPQSGRLGPQRSSVRVNDPDGPASDYEFNDITSCASNCTIEAFDAGAAYRTRYSGYVAVRVAADEIAIAPIGLGGLKGGGGATFPDSIEPPTADRESLDEAYESWATAFNVDGRTGGVTLTPPADLVSGAGGHPYSLAFQRSYSSDNLSEGPLGTGWTHNWNARLNTSTDVNAALGSSSPHHALATIIAAAALHNLFETASSEVADLPSAMLIANWWAGQVFDNTATITRGADSERFYLQPDGVWQPQPGSNASLSRSGTRIAEASQTVPEPGNGAVYNPRTVSEAFNRSGWSFTYQSASGVVEQFTYGFDLTSGNYDPRFTSLRAVHHARSTNATGSGRSFLRRSTDHVAAPDITYTYTTSMLEGFYIGETLAKVGNGSPFGRELNFAYVNELPAGVPVNPYTGPQATEPGQASSAPVSRRLDRVWDAAGQQVEFDYNGFGYLTIVTDLMAQVTTYQYDFDFPVADPLFAGGIYQDRNLLTAIRLPHAPSGDFLTFAYTTDGRALSVSEADSDTTEYFIAGDSRFMTRDAEGAPSYTYYDADGRAFATRRVRSSSNSGSDVITRHEFDAWGRTVGSQTGYASNLDLLEARSATYYDQISNTVLSRNLGATDANGASLESTPIDQVTEYGYSAFPHLRTVQYDALGHAVTTCYERTALAPCNASQIQDPAMPDGLPRATYGPQGEESLIEYDSYGRVTRQRVRVEN